MTTGEGYYNGNFPPRTVQALDEWLDRNVGARYLSEPLGQDWARLAKVGEELGEAIAAFILVTKQNPRKKDQTATIDDVLREMADVIITGVLCIQHFTKNIVLTDAIIAERWIYREGFVPA